MLGKILSFIIFRKTMSLSNSLIESLLVGLTAIIMLGLIASMLIASLIAGSIYVSYNVLIAQGVAPLTAAYMVGGGIFLMLVVVVALAIFCLMRIRQLPKRVLHPEAGVLQKLQLVAEAFLEGFSHPTCHR